MSQRYYSRPTGAEPGVVAPIEDISNGEIAIAHESKSLAISAREQSLSLAVLPLLNKFVWPVYLLGFVGFVGYLVFGWLQTLMLLRRSRPVHLPKYIENAENLIVVESDEIQVPATVGSFKPKAVLPSDWKSWDEQMLSLVISHEARHVRRRDTLVLFLALFNRAVYWFHPLSWILAKRISQLAELACDDDVIIESGQRTDYASCLVRMASRMSTSSQANKSLALSMGMARASLVEKRVNRILNVDRSIGRSPGIVSLAVILLLVATPAAITANVGGFAVPNSDNEIAPSETLVNKDDSINGKVLGLNGSIVAGAKVILRSMPTHGQRSKNRSTKTNEKGEFIFESVLKGEHRLAAFAGKLSSRTEKFRGLIVKPGEPITLQMKKAPSLVVKIVSKDNEPMKNGQVVIQQIDHGRGSYAADVNGIVTIDGLTAQPWTIKTKVPFIRRPFIRRGPFVRRWYL